MKHHSGVQTKRGRTGVMITEEMIPRIEQAFGFPLYDWQKDYLLGNPCNFPSEYQRNVGKTFIYCVKILLSDGEPIPYKRLEFAKFADFPKWGLGPRYSLWFADYMKEINDKLVEAGFETRVVR